MKVAYFDTFSGISGDMTLGAFVSAGVSLDDLRAEIAKLHLPGVELEASHIVRSGITAVKLDVVISSSETKHRHLKHIVEMIDGSPLSARVKRDAKRIFEAVGKAEAKVHNTTIEKVHFHEVGALDSIVDIVGAAVCMELAGVERVYSSPVRLGSGAFVKSDHGTIPIPSPAAVEILKNYPTVLTEIPFELTTPTGAAIIRAMSAGTLATEAMRVSAIGYGAGTKEIPQFPNLLRVLIGEVDEAASEEMVVVEANIDDMNPEVYPYVLSRLLDAGAADVWLTPVVMKKGRPGVVLSALAKAPLAEALAAILFAETTTIGTRSYAVSRRILERSSKRIRTSLGEVTVKVIGSGSSERMVPEFEECRRLAELHRLPLLQIYRTLEAELQGPGVE